jgi:hypothetical protein
MDNCDVGKLVMKRLMSGVLGLFLMVSLVPIPLHGWWQKSITERIKQNKQLKDVINYTTVERLVNDKYKRQWLTSKGELTEEEKQELEDATKGEDAFWSRVEGLRQNGISDSDINKAYDAQYEALRDVRKALNEQYEAFLAAEREKKNRFVMENLVEIERKYLKSTDPEDRELLYSYEKDIKKKSDVLWEEIYELRNKIRQEEGLGKDFELLLLAQIERKYLSKYLNEEDENARDTLYDIISYMFDSLSIKEINALHRRVVKEIKEGVLFENITANLMEDKESSRELKEFIEMFAPPLNIQETIESNKDIKFGFLEGRDKSANVYAKGRNFSRLFNAERMRNCIESNNFTTLAVPKKWIYKVNGQWRVYAEYIPSKKVKFTLEEIKELVEFAEQTGYSDWSRVMKLSDEVFVSVSPNVIADERNGKITIIDTEDRSFKAPGVMYPDESFPKKCKLQSAYSLYKYFDDDMEDDARKWLDDYIIYLKDNSEGRTIIDSLPWSGQFDDPNFDFEKIKKELEEDNEDAGVIQY